MMLRCFHGPATHFDLRYFPLEYTATESILNDGAIGPGADVFLPGLFATRPGTERNIPIVRLGNIAAMPNEPITTQIGKLDAYLIEARSIGGLSGSPVFVTPDPFYTSIGEYSDAYHPFYLLGLMHGHYEVDSSRLASSGVIDDEVINMGIAIVPPVARIMETIQRRELAAMRDEEEARSIEEVMPTMDGGDAAGVDSEFSRFEKLTRKLVNVPKKELDEKRKDEG